MSSPSSQIRFTGIEPTRAHSSDGGLDLYAAKDQRLEPGVTRIKTGTCLEIPAGFAGIIKDRSSMAARGLHVVGGVIDAGYVGEIEVTISTGLHHSVSTGDRIAQIVIVPIWQGRLRRVESLSESSRGDVGFGSSGR